MVLTWMRAAYAVFFRVLHPDIKHYGKLALAQVTAFAKPRLKITITNREGDVFEWNAGASELLSYWLQVGSPVRVLQEASLYPSAAQPVSVRVDFIGLATAVRVALAGEAEDAILSGKVQMLEELFRRFPVLELSTLDELCDRGIIFRP